MKRRQFIIQSMLGAAVLVGTAKDHRQVNKPIISQFKRKP